MYLSYKKVLYIAGRVLLAVPLAVVAAASTGYLFAPVYDFADPQPFSGEGIYNPYDGVDFSTAKKAIFHFHTTRSDGRDSPRAMVAAYRNMGYDIVSVADHHRITPTGSAQDEELRTYEHGLNAHRFHNVVFGADHPCHFQLPLWQTTSQRYETLRRLKNDFPIVELNHPRSVRGLTPEQMRLLSHYDYIEADRNLDNERTLWDTALSAGHYSFIMAGDDLHDLARADAIGRQLTFVMSSGTDATSVMNALGQGHTYSVRVRNPSQHRDSVYIPKVVAVEFDRDTIGVAFSDPAEIRFVGQNGEVRKTEYSATCASYRFAGEDTYVRVEARFDLRGGTVIYLNPLARHSPDSNKSANAVYASLDKPLTILSVTAHALFIILSVTAIVLLFRRKKRECKNSALVMKESRVRRKIARIGNRRGFNGTMPVFPDRCAEPVTAPA